MEATQQIPGVPNGIYSFRTWLDGTHYTSLNTETGEVLGYYNQIQECGCCDYPVDVDWNWADLDEEVQNLIKEEILAQFQEK